MDHLPAYVALERWAAGRRVLLVGPTGPEGARRLIAAGARRVVAVDPHGELPPGVERERGVPGLPGVDGTVDLVACIEPFGTLGTDARRQLVREAHRVLASGGMFAAWIRQAAGESIDFWALEDEVGDVFGRVFMIAQMPWRGFSLAPVVDADVAPRIALLEGLLEDVPEATHYLAVAFRGAPSPALAAALVQECALVPVPAHDDVSGSDAIAELRSRADAAELRVVALEAELEALRSEAAEGQSEALTRSIAEAEGLRAQAEARASKLADALARSQRAEAEAQARATRLAESLAAAERTRDEVALALAELEEQRDVAEANVAMAQERRQQAESRADALRAQLDAIAAQTAESTAELEADRGRLREDLQASTNKLHESLRALQHEREDAEHAAKVALARAEELDAMLRTKQTDLKVLTATVRDLEQSLSRMSERAEARARDLEAQQRETEDLVKRRDALAAERDHLAHQMEVAIAEREGARQLLARVEAELDQARKKLGEQQDRLAAKVEEASRLSGEVQALRERLDHQQTLLDHSRTRAEELSASAAKQDEQGRMLAEIAIDRDRLREELTRRGQQIQTLEDRLWTARDEVQKERLDSVRLSSELERLREHAARSREVEAALGKQVEVAAAELRAGEVARGEVLAQLRAREDEIARLRRDAAALTSESADVQQLRRDLEARGRKVDELKIELERLRAREQDTAAVAKRREEQLSAAGMELERLRKAASEHTGVTAALQSELDVKALEVEQLAASVANLHGQLEEARRRHLELENERGEAQRRLEEAAAEQEVLRRNLRAREQELQDVVSANETSGVEMYKLRRELDAASQSNEQLEEVLRGHVGEALLGDLDITQWPEEAVVEVQRLRAQLSTQARRHAEHVARIETGPAEPGEASADRMRAYRLEAQVRAEEQEYLLGLLEGAEQKIWEMNDASDRNAARLAASLAQLEKHKELLDELTEELEVSRKLLAASQARALEQERLLASERAKMARAGIGPDGLPPSAVGQGNVDDVFAELDRGSGLIELDAMASGVPQPIAGDTTSAHADASQPLRADGPRVVIEQIDDDDPWPEDYAEQLFDASTPARRSPSVVPTARREADDAQPRARRSVLPPAPEIPSTFKRAGTLKAVPGGGEGSGDTAAGSTDGRNKTKDGRD